MGAGRVIGRGGRRASRRWPVAVASLLIGSMLIGLGLAGPSSAGAQVPGEFSDTLVANISSPTDIAFLPDGRMLVTSQSGELWIKGSGAPTVALDISGVTCSGFERGMLGVTVDPEFASNGFVYVFYTFAKFDSCSSNNPNAPVNRVSRFVVSGNSASAGSEFVVVDSMPSPNGNHNAGDLLFGKDGYLYISIGDGGCDLDNSSQCGGGNGNARERNILTGKILRVDRNGVAPDSNPFTGSNAGTCRTTGRTSLTYCRETFAWGLRNPFRFAADPNASTTRIYVNDVGQDVWEEIDNLVAGADYGWNVREGFCANGSTGDCGAPPSGMRNPVFAYQHGSCNSITGGAFVPDGEWPAAYEGTYLYADYVCGRIFKLDGSTSTTFATDIGPIASLQFGPSGSKQSLYYSTYNDEVRKIEFTGQINRPPVARVTATPKFGLSPLSVAFDARTSTDPDGDALTYRWNFGDGSAAGTGPTPSHTFTSATRKVFTVTLTARDSHGASNATTISIDVGNSPPTPVITSPAVSDLFKVGTGTITLTGTATDAQDGTLPPTALKWTVKLHHDTHEHPYFTGTGTNLAMDGPAPEDLLAATNSYLVISLTATDSTGLSTTVTQNLMPHKVDVTVQSVPSKLKIRIESETFSTPKTVVSWEGARLDLEAFDQVTSSGEPVTWSSWSVPGGSSFPYVVPATNSTVTANFALIAGPSFVAIADARVREDAPGTNDGAANRLATRGNTSADSRSYLRFKVSGVGGPVQSAILFVYAEGGSAEGPSVYRTSNEWSESRITWNSRPPVSGGKLDSAGPIANGTWVALDVTRAITGNGTFNFLLLSNSPDSSVLFSREAPDRQPRLVVVGSGSGDVTPPTPPATLTGDAPTSNSVLLIWGAGSDDTGVTGYDIFRNGKLLSSTSSRRFTDTSVAPSTTYTYTVRARDGAGNVSAASPSAIVQTPSLTRTLTFTALADTRVSEAEPDRNFGTSTQLRVEGGSDPDIESYLRFSVSGLPGSVYRAKLRIFVPAGSSTGTTDGPALFRTSTGWQESSVTWLNRPTRSNTVVDDLGAVSGGKWVEFDVTAVTSGNGNYGYALLSVSTDLAVFASREKSTPPQLVITTRVDGLAGQADVIAEPTPVPTATPASTPTPVVALPIVADFEEGSLEAWTDLSGAIVQSDRVRTGQFALRLASNGAPGQPADPGTGALHLGEPQGDLYAAFSIFVEGNAETAIDVLSFQDADGHALSTLVIGETGELGLRNDRSGRVKPITTLDLTTWHEIQVHLVARGGDSSAEVWVDGQLLLRSGSRLSNGDIAALRFGDPSPERTFNLAIDDVTVDDTCVGTCSTDLVTPIPEQTPEATQEPEVTEPAQTEVPTETPEVTPEPTEPPVVEPSPTETPVPETTPEPPTIEPDPTEAA